MSSLIEKVLVIGGSGLIGRAIAHQVVSAGFVTRVGSRSGSAVERATGVHLDLRDPASIRDAVTGIDAVVLNLPLSDGPKDGFVVERDGTRAVLEALSDRPEVPIVKLSEIGVGTDPSFFDLEMKHQAELLIRTSGHPFFAIRPTWIMQAWPSQFTAGPIVLVPGNKTRAIHWVSTTDIGLWIAAALEDFDRVDGKALTAQGPDALTTAQAGARYSKASGKRRAPVPLGGFKALGALGSKQRAIYELMRYYAATPEPFESEELHRLLGPPTVTFDAFLAREVTR